MQFLSKKIKLSVKVKVKSNSNIYNQIWSKVNVKSEFHYLFLKKVYYLSNNKTFNIFTFQISKVKE